ncbi:MAG: VCBS repeat-containing protein, partial [Planctomycetes bacterium]|nr:VCBS repeat-containing protein [Planctomycetota bacterium]
WDGDGDLDIIGASDHGSQADRMWLNNGSLSFTASDLTGTVSETSFGVCAADFDGDNDVDLAFASTGDGLRINYNGLRDSDSTLTFINKAAAYSSLSLGSAVNVLRFDFSDLATSDPFPTEISGLTFDITGTTIPLAGATFELGNGVATPIATGTVMGNNVIFTGLSRSANSGTTATLHLLLTLPTNTMAEDGQVVMASLSATDIDQPTSGTSLFNPAITISNGTGVPFDVTATELRWIQQPPASFGVQESVPVSIEYSDVNGRRDLDAGAMDSLSLVWSGAGSVAPSALTPTLGLASGNIQIAGPGVTGGTLALTDNAGGGAAVATPLFATGINLNPDVNMTYSVFNTASTIPVDGQVHELNLVNFLDGGIQDQLPTRVQSLTYSVTSLMGVDLASNFEFFLSVSGGADIPSTSIAGQFVTFSGAPLFDVPNGMSVQVSLRARIISTNSATIDQQVLYYNLMTSDVVLDPTYTGLNTVGSNGYSGGTVVNVSASQISAIGTPATSAMTGAVIGGMVFEAVDGSGNRDLDYISSLTANWSGMGTPVNNVMAFSAGFADLTANNFSISEPGDLGGSLTLTSGALSPFVITPFNLIDDDDEDS